MKVWTNGKFEEVEIGQKFFVGKCGSGHSVFGEFATLERTTSQHLVFKTESGTVVKTNIENLYEVVGKAKKCGYFVSIKTDRDFINDPVMFY